MATVKKEGNVVYVQTMDKMRRVGTLLGEILETERDRAKHLMQVWQAYGFSKEVMDHKDWFEYVSISETNGTEVNLYLIPRVDLVLHAREHQSQDFERQYFITLEKLQPYKV